MEVTRERFLPYIKQGQVKIVDEASKRDEHLVAQKAQKAYIKKSVDKVQRIDKSTLARTGKGAERWAEEVQKDAEEAAGQERLVQELEKQRRMDRARIQRESKKAAKEAEVFRAIQAKEAAAAAKGGAAVSEAAKAKLLTSNKAPKVATPTNCPKPVPHHSRRSEYATMMIRLSSGISTKNCSHECDCVCEVTGVHRIRIRMQPRLFCFYGRHVALCCELHQPRRLYIVQDSRRNFVVLRQALVSTPVGIETTMTKGSHTRALVD